MIDVVWYSLFDVDAGFVQAIGIYCEPPIIGRGSWSVGGECHLQRS